jgi:CTP:molybdopterin cytidylyltransferase MocA
MVVGIVLAAGAGLRLGRGHPKALVADSEGQTWLDLTVTSLREGGVREVYVVVGAQREAVEAAVPLGCLTVESPNWEAGMGASLGAGLAEVERSSPDADAVIVMLVDTPGVGAGVVRRLVERKSAGHRTHTDAVARAAYAGRPGHPVLIGRAHWPRVLESAVGDRGARDYLASVHVELVECGDIGSGEDIDTVDALAEWSRRARPPG